MIDIGLPRSDGYEIARRLRAAFGNRLRLVALTRYGQADDRRLVQEAGFDAHLAKPVAPKDVLRDVVGTTLTARPAGSSAPHSTRREPPHP